MGFPAEFSDVMISRYVSLQRQALFPSTSPSTPFSCGAGFYTPLRPTHPWKYTFGGLGVLHFCRGPPRSQPKKGQLMNFYLGHSGTKMFNVNRACFPKEKHQNSHEKWGRREMSYEVSRLALSDGLGCCRGWLLKVGKSQAVSVSSIAARNLLGTPASQTLFVPPRRLGIREVPEIPPASIYVVIGVCHLFELLLELWSWEPATGPHNPEKIKAAQKLTEKWAFGGAPPK